MKLNRVKLNTINLNRICLNTVGTCSICKGESKPPQPDITDALIMEDGSLFLMEDGSYFMLEKSAKSRKKAKSMPKIDKSYWNF